MSDIKATLFHAFLYLIHLILNTVFIF